MANVTDQAESLPVTLALPAAAMQALDQTPEQFGDAVRLAAAMFWYSRAELSMGVAAALAGLDITDFLLALSRHKLDIFVVDFDDLDRELARARAESVG